MNKTCPNLVRGVSWHYVNSSCNLRQNVISSVLSVSTVIRSLQFGQNVISSVLSVSTVIRSLKFGQNVISYVLSVSTMIRSLKFGQHVISSVLSVSTVIRSLKFGPGWRREILQTVNCWLSYNLYINLACLGVCFLFVCLYPINVKTAELIGLNFFVGSRVTPGKVYRWSNFQKFASIKIRFLKNLKIHKILFENPRNFLFLLFVNKENPCVFYFYKWNKRWARSALNFL